MNNTGNRITVFKGHQALVANLRHRTGGDIEKKYHRKIASKATFCTENKIRLNILR